MVSILEVQAAIIVLLKAHPGLVAVVGTEIREDEWSATNFKYPCVRVSMGDVVQNGPCLESVSFSVSSNTVDASSFLCLQLADIVVMYLEDKSLVGIGFKSAAGIFYIRRGAPTKGANQRWQATTQFKVNVSTP